VVIANGISSDPVQLYQINTSALPVAGGSASGGGNYLVGGTSLTVTATPNAGYRFVNWTEGGNPVSASANYTFTLSADRTLVANFINTYTIVTSSSPAPGGTTAGGGLYDIGATVTVTATPKVPYIFLNWTENGTNVSNSASYTFTANADRNLVANFIAVWRLTTGPVPAGGGSTTGDGSYYNGTSVTVTATPNPGYAFLRWTDGATAPSTSASYTFTILGNRTLNANFVPTYTIATSASPGGTGSTSGGGIYNSGTSVTVTASPSPGYGFVNWTESGTPVSKNASYNFSIGSNRTLVANFIFGFNDANLASLLTSAGKLSPVFSNSTTNYNLSLPNTALNLILTPQVNQAGATVTVSGTAVNSGSPSTPIPLTVGLNMIPVVVTAMDGTTMKTYTVNVTRSSRKSPLDLNGDGKDDLVFQNTAGQLAVWYLNGFGSTLTAGFLYSGGLGDWRLVGKADMNNDGNTDLVFQNAAGQIAVWFLNGNGGTLTAGYLYSGGLGDWRIVGIADLNGDGNADLVFQNKAGQIVVWYLNGNGGTLSAGFLSTDFLGDLRIVGVTDMNGDGNADIVFQNGAGQIRVWYLNGAGAISSTNYISTVPLGDWKVVSVADINGDGNADFVLQNNAGQIVVWYTDAAGSIYAAGFLYPGGLGDWRIH
ncbi:MAG: FG-GAP-like repeat-containing protein, partial [Chthoniobacteraceae bacterium]